ncbi:hypothetical protein AVEN_124185-1 [Araneus ventricosus]|uniref:Uncharacterized protein n=1 Tax=Araneus ventricosus TaxID=182803 RepID=A0A4Y2MXX8_ARAVE|nr:hypothetical protein AVEN_124185-1 [Araneus ventricosus]
MVELSSLAIFPPEKRKSSEILTSGPEGSRLCDKFKRTGSVQDDEKAKVTATSSVATGEAKERVEDFFAANHLLIHLNLPLAKETHTYTIARSNDHAHQVWYQLLEASAIY